MGRGVVEGTRLHTRHHNKAVRSQLMILAGSRCSSRKNRMLRTALGGEKGGGGRGGSHQQDIHALHVLHQHGTVRSWRLRSEHFPQLWVCMRTGVPLQHWPC